jgi:hypothetical protein
MISVLLAINRCVEMICPRLNEVLFSPRMLKFWFIAASFYGLFGILFTVPVKFNGIYMAWFFSPYPGYNTTKTPEFHNAMHTVNNIIESSSIVGMYSIFGVVLAFRSIKRSNSSASMAKRKSQIRSFIQVLLISVVNVVACSVKLYPLDLKNVLFSFTS